MDAGESTTFETFVAEPPAVAVVGEDFDFVAGSIEEDVGAGHGALGTEGALDTHGEAIDTETEIDGIGADPDGCLSQNHVRDALTRFKRGLPESSRHRRRRQAMKVG